MSTRAANDCMLGNRALERFDACIVGSGAGGATVAHALTSAGLAVLILEAGDNPFPGLDDPGELPPPLHSNDELKYALRDYLEVQSFLEPRSFRADEHHAAVPTDDVNVLPKAVGGAFQFSGACAAPRFTEIDFELVTAMRRARDAQPGLAVPGFGADAASANFADWPFRYADLEPFYAEAEHLYGVQGAAGNPFESWRSAPHPMPPGVPMYSNLLLAEGARRTLLDGSPLTPHVFPLATNSRPYDGRPPCIDCGFCSGFGCPNHAKGSPAVTVLRRALLSGRCQLRYQSPVLSLTWSGRSVTGVVYVDPAGRAQTARADRYVLAANGIESPRLCLLSDPGGPGLGNASGQLGRNLMFHMIHRVQGFLPERTHGERGRTNTHGVSDLRGVEPGGATPRVFRDGTDPRVVLGGTCTFTVAGGLPITNDGLVYTRALPGPLGARYGLALKNAMRDQPLGQHLIGLELYGEDAPQLANRIDLDPSLRDVQGRPAARITYRHHPFELGARAFYVPIMAAIVRNTGVRELSFAGQSAYAFPEPCQPALAGPPRTRHVLGTLRMGLDPAISVTDASGRFHDLDNLWAADGSLLPTSSGWNPTLTIIAVALKVGRGIAASGAAIAPDATHDERRGLTRPVVSVNVAR